MRFHFVGKWHSASVPRVGAATEVVDTAGVFHVARECAVINSAFRESPGLYCVALRQPGIVDGLSRMRARAVVVGTALVFNIAEFRASGKLAFSGLGARFLETDLRCVLIDSQ